MSTTDLGSGVARKTVRFAWKDGPTKGKVHEHVFHADGTVEWHDAGQGAATKPERPKFLDEEISSGIRLLSYLSSAGFTLTVVLNAQDGSITGVASNDKTWMPVHGAYEVMK